MNPGPVERIIRTCCEHFRRTREELMSDSRIAPIVHMRHAAWLLIDEETDHSQLWIVKRFGRNHTTVRYAVAKMKARQETDPIVKSDLAVLRAKIARSSAA